MRQSASLLVGPTIIQVDLPPAETEVMPGVSWGSIEAFPTPAYWVYQVMARRVVGTPMKYRLGQTLTEEVAACILGGHGIPAGVGVAAFRRLQSLGILGEAPSEVELNRILSEPMQVGGREVKYRFARQKARYLSLALARLACEHPPVESGRILRDWLIELPGIGLKTASWIARNWLDADDVAILDIHILRAGALGGFFSETMRVDRDYLDLEARFLQFSQAIGVRPSELDATIWFEMMSSPLSVSQLMGGRRSVLFPAPPRGQVLARQSARRRSNKGHTDTHQARLIE